MKWARKKQPPIRTLIGEGTVFEGNLTFVEGMRIDGTVIGDVQATAGSADSMLVIGDKAKVTGRVGADQMIVVGSVEGPIHCTGLLELQPTAQVRGDVHYELLEMHPGAVIDGELRPLKRGERPNLSTAPLTLAASNDA